VTTALSTIDDGNPNGRLTVLHPAGSLPRSGDAAAAPSPVRVLIADGQALVRAGFRLLLEAGPRITVVGEAASGEEAVVLAESLRPDVALIDARLPGLDSVEATGKIFSDSGVEVMLLTTSEDDARIFAALRAGANGLLLKDTEPAELVQAVELLARGEPLLSPPLIAELASRPEPCSPSRAAAARRAA
jgi:DNA-binding NarL/FixJ family response regulator